MTAPIQAPDDEKPAGVRVSTVAGLFDVRPVVHELAPTPDALAAFLRTLKSPSVNPITGKKNDDAPLFLAGGCVGGIAGRNMVASELVVLDVDDGPPLDWAIEKVKAAGLWCVAGPTPRHLHDGRTHKYRLAFRPAAPIADAPTHKATVEALVARLGFAVDPASAVRTQKYYTFDPLYVLGGKPVEVVAPSDPIGTHVERPAWAENVGAELATRRLDDARDWLYRRRETSKQNGAGRPRPGEDRFNKWLATVAHELVKGYCLPYEEAAAMLDQYIDERLDPAVTREDNGFRTRGAERVCSRVETTSTDGHWGYMLRSSRDLWPEGLAWDKAREVWEPVRAAGGAANDNREPTLDAPDPFADFVLVEQPEGFVIARRIGPDHVQPVLDELTLRRALAERGVAAKDTKRLIDEWKVTTAAVLEPATIAMPDEPGLAWCRLPFALPEPGGPETWPAWQEFVGRVSDPDFFMAWLGSVFDRGSRSRQILWLRGDGEDGKSTVFRTLYGILGTCVATIPDVGLGDDGGRFLAMKAYGHRLVVVSDCKNTKILRHGVVRQLTSGDLVNIEGKGKDGFTAITWTKLAVCSNYPPDISTGRADLSRAVLIEVAPSVVTSDAGWETRLAAEAPAFLAACLARYLALCPERGRIPVSERAQEDTREAAIDSEIDVETRARRLLEWGAGDEVAVGELRMRAKDYWNLNQLELNGLVDWCTGQGGLRRVKRNDGRFLVGARLKTAGAG